MKRIGFFLLPVIIVAFTSIVVSCASAPQTEDPPPGVRPADHEAPVENTASPVSPPVETVFDPKNISQEVYDATFVDVRALISELNRIISARNYNAWIGHLDGSFLSLIGSPEFLEEITEDLYRRDQIVASNLGRDPRVVQKRILYTSKDYFDHVVVPSRSNDRVDDIAFITETLVRARTMDSRGNMLILYNLAFIDNKWKITN